MKYIKRNAETTLNRAAEMFPAVLLTGARQVGKATLLRQVVPDLPFLTLLDPLLLQKAIEDGGSFLNSHHLP